MDIALAGAGVFVTILVVIGMILIVPRGIEDVLETTAEVDASAVERAEPSAAVAVAQISGSSVGTS